MAHHIWMRRLLLLAVLAPCGPGCRSTVQQQTNVFPRVLPPGPTMEQILQAVNGNTDRITSFTCARATLSGEGFPSLRTMIAFQKPNYLRLRAETALTGPELDLGSNDQVFWFWLRRNQPPTLFFCRHDQFERSPARQSIAFEPQWLIEALGLPYLNSHLPLEGPFPAGIDRLEVRTVEETVQGPRTKSTVLDAIRGFVVQQSVYDSQGRLIASAEASQHRRDPVNNLILPGVVSMNSPTAGITIRIDLGPVEINRPRVNVGNLWMMPEYAGSSVVDLGNPQAQPGQAGPAQAAAR
jgi:hypothetical protein